MADEIPTGADDVIGCDEVRESIDLFVLDALEPTEVAAIEAHLASCAACRAEQTQAQAAVGSLLLLAPTADVPVGFVERVVASAPGGSAPPVAPPSAPAHGGGPAEVPLAPGPAPDPTVRPLDPARRARQHRFARIATVAAAVVVVALLLTAVGAALGTVFASDGQVAGPPATAPIDGRSASLVSVDGLTVGSVVVDDDAAADPPTLVMVVDRVASGVAYQCVVRDASGELVTVGSWTPTDEGRASWAVSLDPALRGVEEVLLVGPGDTTLATATLS